MAADTARRGEIIARVRKNFDFYFLVFRNFCRKTCTKDRKLHCEESAKNPRGRAKTGFFEAFLVIADPVRFARDLMPCCETP
jgi:hypothetical protein